jgi:hypothetical protein
LTKFNEVDDGSQQAPDGNLKDSHAEARRASEKAAFSFRAVALSRFRDSILYHESATVRKRETGVGPTRAKKK